MAQRRLRKPRVESTLDRLDRLVDKGVPGICTGSMPRREQVEILRAFVDGTGYADNEVLRGINETLSEWLDTAWSVVRTLQSARRLSDQLRHARLGDELQVALGLVDRVVDGDNSVDPVGYLVACEKLIAHEESRKEGLSEAARQYECLRARARTEGAEVIIDPEADAAAYNMPAIHGFYARLLRMNRGKGPTVDECMCDGALLEKFHRAVQIYERQLDAALRLRDQVQTPELVASEEVDSIVDEAALETPTGLELHVVTTDVATDDDSTVSADVEGVVVAAKEAVRLATGWAEVPEEITDTVFAVQALLADDTSDPDTLAALESCIEFLDIWFYGFVNEMRIRERDELVARVHGLGKRVDPGCAALLRGYLPTVEMINDAGEFGSATPQTQAAFIAAIQGIRVCLAWYATEEAPQDEEDTKNAANSQIVETPAV